MSEKKKDKPKEKIKFINIMFENTINQTFNKFLSAKFSSAEKYKIYKLFKTITESPACKAYLETKQELVKQFEEKQKDLKEDDPNRKPALMQNIDGMMELLEQESDFEIEKITINAKKIPENITAADMANIDWIIDFTE